MPHEPRAAALWRCPVIGGGRRPAHPPNHHQLAQTAEDSLPLAADEQHELDHLEGVVERGLTTFIEVGTALARIRDGRLYRQTHTDFGIYVEHRFGLSRTYGYQMIAAAGVVEGLSAIADSPMPATESQARELVGMPPEDAAALLTQVADVDGKVTARAIHDHRHDGPTPKRQRRPLPDAYRDLVYDLGKTVSAIERLHEDDRWQANAATVAAAARGELASHRRALDIVATDLDEAEPPHTPVYDYRTLVDAVRLFVTELARLHHDGGWQADGAALAEAHFDELSRCGDALGIIATDLAAHVNKPGWFPPSTPGGAE